MNPQQFLEIVGVVLEERRRVARPKLYKVNATEQYVLKLQRGKKLGCAAVSFEAATATKPIDLANQMVDSCLADLGDVV